jgi:glutathione S-transferase
LILEELGLPYELNAFSFEAVKQKPFIDINPNGRVPGKPYTRAPGPVSNQP